MLSLARDHADEKGMKIFDENYPMFKFLINDVYKFGYYYFKNNYPVDKNDS